MKVVATNRRATFDLEIVEKLEAGMMLTGAEVKACRNGNISLTGAYISFLGGKPILKKAKIAPYAYAFNVDYQPERDRPLLLTKSQIANLASVTAEKGMTIVPLEVRAGKYIKVLLGVGRGRKRLDKRQRIKERDVERRMRRGREL